jgi:hypothetical protein
VRSADLKAIRRCYQRQEITQPDWE